MSEYHETDEFRFVRHAIELMGDPPNQAPDRHPGGSWMSPPFHLSWGQPDSQAPPRLYIRHSGAMCDLSPKHGDMAQRVQFMCHKVATLNAGQKLSGLNLRDRAILSAILAWNP